MLKESINYICCCQFRGRRPKRNIMNGQRFYIRYSRISIAVRAVITGCNYKIKSVEHGEVLIEESEGDGEGTRANASGTQKEFAEERY